MLLNFSNLLALGSTKPIFYHQSLGSYLTVIKDLHVSQRFRYIPTTGALKGGSILSLTNELFSSFSILDTPTHLPGCLFRLTLFFLQRYNHTSRPG